jgi:Glycosyl transferase family 90
MAGCTHAFPMPNYMTIIDTQISDDNWRGVFKEFDQKYPWESKIRKLVWRGALSEAEWTKALSSVRWRVAKFVQEAKNDQYDIGLTGIPSWLTEKVDFDLTQIGGFKEGISPMSAFQQYTAVLDMDGNSWSSRFGTLLCYNSVVIKVEPQYFDYFHAELKPWTHYIPVKNDLSDFQENVAWALDPQNDVAVKNIIKSANQWCSYRIIPTELAIDLLDIFESYVRLLDRADPNWSAEWQKTKEMIMSSQNLQMARL